MKTLILSVALLFVLASSAYAQPTAKCKGGVCIRRPFSNIYVGPGANVEVRQGIFGLRRTIVNTR